SLNKSAQNSVIYGECGGYMVLGEGLVDADGQCHTMAGLLPLETSFATRKLHLGYRHLTAQSGPFQGRFAAHEFHYASTLKAQGKPLFCATDAEGTALPDMGLSRGHVHGSFAHIIDAAE
ncbi:MAG: cobyrinic acid a,c-diamide synthase, partial [Pseudomonadota bacterium]